MSLEPNRLKQMYNEPLNEREKQILQAVIHYYILTANPVGSRALAKFYHLPLSAATVRNVMADLEDKGCLVQPHTSAGRVPTDLGYRFYVDFLMDMERLPTPDRQRIDEQVESMDTDLNSILRATVRLLGDLSHQLGVGLAPRFAEGRLERLDLVPLGGDKVLVVIALKSGIARTITLEIGISLQPKQLDRITRALNQRLAGLTLREIDATIVERLQNVPDLPVHVARVFIEAAHRVFQPTSDADDVVVEGARNILEQPEFSQSDQFQSIIELMEDKQMVVHILNEHLQLQRPITIGEEITGQRISQCSIISANYSVGDLRGTLGIIGPRRMNYSHILALVNYTAQRINERLAR